MSRIYWDSMLFIYWMEDHPAHARRVQHVRERMSERNDVLLASPLTFAEVLTGARRRHDLELAGKITAFFHSDEIDLVPFTMGAAARFADIRGDYGVSPADAIHLACAAEAGTDVFLTNDDSLAGKTVPGIQFVVPMYASLL